MSTLGQSSTASAVAKQGAETSTTGGTRSWVEASVWTERMLSALGNGVKVAKGLLRECRVVRASHGLAGSETVSMKKPPTGEPDAGKPPVRFGGRGGATLPDPYSPAVPEHKPSPHLEPLLARHVRDLDAGRGAPTDAVKTPALRAWT
jgi:hypothetical protein